MNNDKFDRNIRIFTLFVSVAMPIAVGFAGYFIQLRISEYQIHQSVVKDISSKLVDRRLYIYDQIKHPLNDIYCYIEEVGDWESLSALGIRKTRHKLNNIMYANRAIWSPETFQLYQIYIDSIAFYIDSKNGHTRIRASFNPERRMVEDQNTASKYITGERDILHRETYHRLNVQIAKDLILNELMVSQL